MRPKGSGQSALLLLDVIDCLNALRIPYAIIGAVAASFHGVVRASLDADALISLRSSRADIAALSAALQKAGLTSTHRTGDPRDPIGGVLSVEDRFHNRVDLLMKIRGMTEAVFARTIGAAFMKAQVRVVGLEDFIAMKILAGSPKDLSDATGALQVSFERLNRPLLKALVQPYGKQALRTLGLLLQGRYIDQGTHTY